MLLIDRDILKSKIVLKRLSRIDMCSMLNITENSYYNKLSGKRGFTEQEIFVLAKVFGKSIFFDFSCYEKRKRKEEK